jgi:Amt family ammonium transporter
MQEANSGRIIFRNNLVELTEGLSDIVSEEAAKKIQDEIGAQRIIAIPIVVEREALGVLIGFSRDAFIEDDQVRTMEAFANQSALLLEAATLIDRLKRMNVELKEANQVKSEFLATMSHELRTPLTAIIGFSELLVEGVMGEMTEEQKDSLKEVLHNAADLLELINSLLDLTKIESGKMKLDIRTFELSEALKRVSNTIAPLVHKKSQRFVLDIADAIPTMTGDERKIQQVILNLFANANKFTPDGGTITSSVRYFRSADEIKDGVLWWSRVSSISKFLKEGCVEIIVEDDGIGIQGDYLDSIFEMFHQVDGSATRSFGGTGVGLALARKFVELHSGKIWVESEFGNGAKFTVVLPIKMQEDRSMKQEA